MLKRILGIFLCFTMLFLATFPVTAVNSEETTGGDTEATPTIESILNDYHAKSAALSAASTADASTYSRTVSEDPQDQLKQETIAELYAAGYAAYDLNSSTYQSLEQQLSTDFSAMGLDPDGSYIVVISGEEDTQNQTSPGNNSRVITLPPHVWEGDDVSHFSYTYNGTVYEMRYATVVSSGEDELATTNHYSLAPIYNEIGNNLQNFLSTLLFACLDELSENWAIGTLSSLVFPPDVDVEPTQIQPGSLTLYATTYWDCNYIQVWDPAQEIWVTAQCSDKATSGTYFVGQYRGSTGDCEEYHTEMVDTYMYSPKYNNASQRKLDAMEAYDYGWIALDCIYNVDFYLEDESGEVFTDGNGNPLIRNRRTVSLVLPTQD